MRRSYYTISAPKGIKASFANLKHWRPNGMPIIVMHNNTPFIAAHIARGMPLIIIQKMLAIRDGAPPPYCTSLPNGANASEASLKHCSPMGIPIIVMHQSKPAKHHASACHIPPHIIHIALPRQPICSPKNLPGSGKPC